MHWDLLDLQYKVWRRIILTCFHAFLQTKGWLGRILDTGSQSNTCLCQNPIHCLFFLPTKTATQDFCQWQDLPELIVRRLEAWGSGDVEEKGEKKTVKPSSDHHQHQLAVVVATNCQLELKVASSHGWVLEKGRRRENGKQIILHHHPPFCPISFRSPVFIEATSQKFSVCPLISSLLFLRQRQASVLLSLSYQQISGFWILHRRNALLLS